MENTMQFTLLELVYFVKKIFYKIVKFTFIWAVYVSKLNISRAKKPTVMRVYYIFTMCLHCYWTKHVLRRMQIGISTRNLMLSKAVNAVKHKTWERLELWLYL